MDTLARSQFQLIFATELLGMVFACHGGTIGYDRLLLKDRHVLVVRNFILLKQALSQAFGTFARHSLRHSHALFGTAFEL